MRRLYSLISVIALAGLTACPLIDADDYATRLRPTISVSQTQAAVGEFVEISVESGFSLLESSDVPNITMSRVTLGACFSARASETLYGLCAPDIDNPVLPSHLQVSSDNAYVLKAGDIIVKRGQTVTIKHTFAFTVTKAETVQVFGDMQFLEKGYDTLSDISGSATTITFR